MNIPSISTQSNYFRRSNVAQRQRGMVLPLSMIILLVVTLLGITAIQGLSMDERMSSNRQQRSTAFQDAEGKLRAAELVLKNSAADAVFTGADLTITDWMSVTFPDTGYIIELLGKIDATTTENQSSGGIMVPTLAGSPMIGANTDGDANSVRLYRITARGESADSVVILQSTYKK